MNCFKCCLLLFEKSYPFSYVILALVALPSSLKYNSNTNRLVSNYVVRGTQQ
jgi:hypothetical protein